MCNSLEHGQQLVEVAEVVAEVDYDRLFSLAPIRDPDDSLKLGCLPPLKIKEN